MMWLRLVIGICLIGAGALSYRRSDRRASTIDEGMATWAGAGRRPPSARTLRAWSVVIMLIGAGEIAFSLFKHPHS